MSRLRHADILLELIDLVDEVMADVRQQLLYYRASVYKDETAGNVRRKVDQLRLIATVTGDVQFHEILHDYDAMNVEMAQQIAPGECSFSTRVTTLLGALHQHMNSLRQNILHERSVPSQLTSAVHQHRRELLAICRHGSRQWSLFQSM